MPEAVEVIDLVKTYGSLRAVDGVGFCVATGEIVGMLGPNGAGKTSTLECLLGLRAPDSGKIHIDGIDALANPTTARRRVGAVLQSTALQDKITPREALRLFAGFYDISHNTNQWLEQAGLSDKADAPFDSLSGGQRQRLALALALLHEPAVLVLDEPTAGLDPPARHELHERIRSLAQNGCAVLLSTHYIEEAQSLCDRVVIIDHGKVIATGSPTGLIADAPARVIVRTKPALHADQWTSLTSTMIEGDSVTIESADVTRTIVQVVHLLESLNVELLDLQIHRPTLEHMFLQRTGTAFMNINER